MIFRRWFRYFIPVFLLIISGIATESHAAPFRMFGYDTAAMGTANSNVAYGESYSVLFSNPALMSRFEPQAGAGLAVYIPNLRADLMDRPKNADVNMKYLDTNVSMYQHVPDRPIPTIELKTQREDNHINDPVTYFLTGGTYDFNIDGFRVGGLTVLPLVEVLQISSYYFDEREQYYTNTVHFPLFGEWSPIIGGMVGTSYSPVKYVSFGFSLQINVGLVADMGIFVPEATVQEYGLMNVSGTKAVVKFRPIIGFQTEPTDWMAIGVTWRNESYVRTDAKGRLDLWNYHDSTLDQTIPRFVVQSYDMVLDYEPMELSGALGFKYASWMIQGGITWNRWSQYIDHHGKHPEEVAINKPINPGDLIVNGDHYKWKDTISTNIGTTYKYLGWGEARLGFAYSPSPVPDQVGRTNYADNDLWCLAVGHKFTFDVFKKKLMVDLGLQFWQMLQKTVNKDPRQIRDEFPDNSRTILESSVIASAEGLQTNNPGFPGYTQKGWLIVTSASVGMEF